MHVEINKTIQHFLACSLDKVNIRVIMAMALSALGVVVVEKERKRWSKMLCLGLD